MSYINAINTNKKRQSGFASRINICIIANFSVEPFFTVLLKAQFSQNNIEAIIQFVSLDSLFDSMHSKIIGESDLLVVWIDFFTLKPDLDTTLAAGLETTENTKKELDLLCRRIHEYLQNISFSEILWLSFDGLVSKNYIISGRRYNTFFRELNNTLIILSTSGAIVLIDLEYLIAETGVSAAYSFNNLYRWCSRYSSQLYKLVAKEVYKQYLVIKSISKKCLVLDCDNVLWGGILSEDGLNNLKLDGNGLGSIYQHFQRFVLSLYHHGIILAICSKNDLADVLFMFREHSGMILKEEHIACFQVNWNNKHENIIQIAKELNINTDSMVFIDDSPVEVEAVKALLPEVVSILYEHDVIYEKLTCFNVNNNTSILGVAKRNETYRSDKLRKSLKAKYDDYDSYIKALDLKVDIHKTKPIEYIRVSELVQRANRCTNGKRYTVSEIKEKNSSNSSTMYSVFSSDRFSDLGLIGVVELDGDILTLFTLSCRAFGRGIEDKMLSFIKDNHTIRDFYFHQTGKNEWLMDVLRDNFICFPA